MIKFFHSPTDALLLILENSKIYIKTYIKIAPTCFGLRSSSESLHLSLAKVALMFKKIGKITSLCVMRWCDGMLYPGMVCVLHAAQSETRSAQHIAHTPHLF
jgi:hypothetical protein